MLFLLFGQLMVKFGLLFISTSGHCALVSKESGLSHNQNYSQTCPIDRLTDMFVWRTHLRIKMLKVEHTHGERDFILNGPFHTSYYFLSVLLTVNKNCSIKVVNDSIRTRVQWYQRQPRCNCATTTSRCETVFANVK